LTIPAHAVVVATRKLRGLLDQDMDARDEAMKRGLGGDEALELHHDLVEPLKII
jgi:hypothetical protein